MSLESEIRTRLEQTLAPTYLEVIDESAGHSHGGDSHFKVIVVSEKFAGLSKVKRQQLVYGPLKPLFDEGLHALSQSTFTPDEWEKAPEVDRSPGCMGRR